ncbi:hypothetical protein D9Q98_009404 [Chlorella vulgaris]|uniref:Uncharacterized protein n=1 Tax=Chlorella vulgaris TaxID=3077 RepID=A0A9D4TPD9_CHLVU|nr:hypothetical protein D9Q98_009404 [Chlorella vulgaris]
MAACRTLLALAALATLALSTNAALPELANPGGPPFLSAYFQSQEHDSGELSSLRLNVNSTFSEIYADDGAAVAFSGLYTSWECGPEPGSYFAITNATRHYADGTGELRTACMHPPTSFIANPDAVLAALPAGEDYHWCEYGLVDLAKGVILWAHNDEQCSSETDHWHELSVLQPLGANENTCGTPTLPEHDHDH